ncbi:Xyloglucan-specific endo-beta-1,4-glucanase 1-like protein [Cladobotryum mycophilum]|uniref:Xyloglucan-specific endo-beta-1,4-glucanase 1-like protein n=1 Tax=Cladobotryum mycophilum TaxID=491253 RepID=A0ABR0SQE3_9HYPO
MTIRFLINFFLIALPIGTSLGILFGLQANRAATGQAPLFAPKPTDGPGSDGKPKPKQGLGHEALCMKSYGFTPDTKGQQYILNPNQWNWNAGDPGGLCMNVTYFNNGTYPTKFVAPEFYVTWQYPQGPENNPVHAFPNVEAKADVLPTPVGDITKMDLELEWSYATGNGTMEAASKADLTTAKLNTNVAIDMFIDADKKLAQLPGNATYEVMIWLAAYGDSTQPLGYNDGVKATKTVNGTAFSLYQKQNQQKQWVLTWYPEDPTLKFYGDVSSLISTIFTLNLNGLPSKSDYLGYVSLGSEAFYSPEVVTFNVPHFSIDIETSASSS